MMNNNTHPKRNEIYAHRGVDNYKVISVSKHTITDEILVNCLSITHGTNISIPLHFWITLDNLELKDSSPNKNTKHWFVCYQVLSPLDNNKITTKSIVLANGDHPFEYIEKSNSFLDGKEFTLLNYREIAPNELDVLKRFGIPLITD